MGLCQSKWRIGNLFFFFRFIYNTKRFVKEKVNLGRDDGAIAKYILDDHFLNKSLINN